MTKVIYLFLLIIPAALAQPLAPLTVDKIMRDPKWMGVAPSNLFWSHDSKQVYFNWNPENQAGDSLYVISLTNKTPQKVSPQVRRALPPGNGVYNKTSSKKLFEKNGDLFLLEMASGKIIQITNTLDHESNASFTGDESKVIFTANGNLFSWELATGAFSQLTDFKKGSKRGEVKPNEQEKWLKEDQLTYFEILKQRSETKKAAEKNRRYDQPNRPKPIYVDDKSIGNMQLSLDGNFVTYVLTKNPNVKNTIVPNYVTESGFTEDIPARTKVGSPQSTSELFVYDIARDSVISIKTDDLPGIFDVPEYKKDYAQKENKGNDKKAEVRSVVYSSLIWSADGKNNVLALRSHDNKDRWIVSLDFTTRKFKLIDRQHDDAWIGGPGTGGFFAGANLGWLADSKTVWFQSEESGYSHLYITNVVTGKKQALTSGKYEVQTVQLSRDNKFFYLTTNEVHPGEKHFL